MFIKYADDSAVNMSTVVLDQVGCKQLLCWTNNVLKMCSLIFDKTVSPPTNKQEGKGQYRLSVTATV